MKKVKLAIIIIYIVFLTLITGLTAFFIIKTVKKGKDLYFVQERSETIKLPFQESDIDNLIEILKKMKIL
jgi:uncharacterized protein YxeA